jgi:hypothetical protein
MFPFLWIGFAIAVGVWASNRGRHGLGWFLIACAISPILAGVFLAVTKNIATEAEKPTSIEETHVRCEQCAEFVLPQAKICKHCGIALNPDMNFEMRLQKDKSKTKKEDRNNLIIGFLFIVGLVAIAKLLSQ